MPNLHPAIRNTWDFLLDILYPPRCGGCDKRGTLFCDDCLSSIHLLEPAAHQVERIDALLSGGTFGGPLRQSIHRLKYESDSPQAKPLAQLIIRALALDPSWVADDGTPPVLVPVPLHPAKKRARGYNQSELLANELARITGWQVQHGLIRVKATRSQVGLEASERAENVRDAFEWQGGTPPPRIMLIDDVCTTGSTLSECAFALLSKGAENIFAATAARAVAFGPNADS